MNKLLWHFELPGVEGLVVRDVALRLGDGDNHVVPLLAIYLLRRDGPLEMVLLKERKKLLFRKKCKDFCSDQYLDLSREISTQRIIKKRRKKRLRIVFLNHLVYKLTN